MAKHESRINPYIVSMAKLGHENLKIAKQLYDEGKYLESELFTDKADLDFAVSNGLKVKPPSNPPVTGLLKP